MPNCLSRLILSRTTSGLRIATDSVISISSCDGGKPAAMHGIEMNGHADDRRQVRWQTLDDTRHCFDAACRRADDDDIPGYILHCAGGDGTVPEPIVDS